MSGMKPLVPLALLLSVFTASAFAVDPGKLIFQDDFNRIESKSDIEDLGNGWGTNRKSRAQGDKQVALKDGALRIYISPHADHAVSVTHAAARTISRRSVQFQELT
jgi:hypothetical protein